MKEPIIRVTKIFRFEAAHALENYDGPCKNIHGHSYELSVTVRGKVIKKNGHPKDGMVMDFKELKAIVEAIILKPFDHSLILNEATLFTLDHPDESMRSKIMLLPFQPSCENLIAYFAEMLKDGLPSQCELQALKLSETNTSYAEWFQEDQDG